MPAELRRQMRLRVSIPAWFRIAAAQSALTIASELR
jgi:hypothetical protein